MSAIRNLKYSEALREAMGQALRIDQSVFLCGIGADGASGIFGTTVGLAERFGRDRVLDMPISEQAITFMSIGAANAGLRPVLIHQRLDFLILTMDHIANWIGPWRFISGGVSPLPVTIRAIVGKGWGQGAQHSKSLYSWFAHVPGIQVVVPATPYDAKGLMLSSIFSNSPTIVIEGRSLFDMTEPVPECPYFIEIGKSTIRRVGADVTIVAFGATLPLAMTASEELMNENISAEVIDLRTISPLDHLPVLNSIKKTGRLVVVEGDWKECGIGAEIITKISEELPSPFKETPIRVNWPSSYVPTSFALESIFYPNAESVKEAVRRLVGVER